MMKIGHIIRCQFLGVLGQVYFEDDNTANHQDFLADDIINLQINLTREQYVLKANGEYELLIERTFDGLKDIDMNHHDYIKVINLSYFFNLHHLIGLNIQAVQSLFYQSVLTGIVIIFECQSIYIVNLGEQIRLFTESPDFLKQKEYRLVDEK